MKTLGEVLKLSTQYLQERQVSRARRCVEELLADVLGLKRLDLYMQFDRPLDEKELAILRQHLARRGKGEPLDYILKKTTFFNCILEISPAVLIPRPETEVLLDKVCSQLKKIPLEDKIAWDICSGSGCLGIGLKNFFPQLQVTLCDISPQALEIAKNNIFLNNLEIDTIQGDLLSPFSGKKADIILCNPPYVSQADYMNLDREVKDFEPSLALVGGETGLEFYARLAKDLPSYLKPGAKIFFEIGSGQREGVLDLFSASCWKCKVVERDWSGLDRFFFLEIE